MVTPVAPVAAAEPAPLQAGAQAGLRLCCLMHCSRYLKLPRGHLSPGLLPALLRAPPHEGLARDAH